LRKELSETRRRIFGDQYEKTIANHEKKVAQYVEKEKPKASPKKSTSKTMPL
jgi:hypothetical protein